MPVRFLPLPGWCLHSTSGLGVGYAVEQVTSAISGNSGFLRVVSLVNFDQIGSAVTVVSQHRVNVFCCSLQISRWY